MKVSQFHPTSILGKILEKKLNTKKHNLHISKLQEIW